MRKRESEKEREKERERERERSSSKYKRRWTGGDWRGREVKVRQRRPFKAT